MSGGAMLDRSRLDELRHALGDDRVRGLVGIFFGDLAARPDRIAGHLRSGDLQRVRIEAHSLKGAALSIGANQVGNAAAAVETALPGTEMLLAVERLDQAVAAALRVAAAKRRRSPTDHWHVPEPSL